MGKYVQKNCYISIANALVLLLAIYMKYIDNVMQNCGGSSVLSMEMPHFCSKPSIWCMQYW